MLSQRASIQRPHKRFVTIPFAQKDAPRMLIERCYKSLTTSFSKPAKDIAALSSPVAENLCCLMRMVHSKLMCNGQNKSMRGFSHILKNGEYSKCVSTLSQKMSKRQKGAGTQKFLKSYRECVFMKAVREGLFSKLDTTQRIKLLKYTMLVNLGFE